MNFYADSNYIHGKICGLHSLLLAAKDYYDIAKNGNLQPVLPGLDTYNIKNEHVLIKEKIFSSQVNMVISLAEASRSSRGIFILFLRYFETLNLKLACAKAFGREPYPFIWYDTGNSAVLPRGMLSDVRDPAGLSEYTGRTWMSDVLASAAPGSFEEAEFSIDRAVLRIAAEFSCSMKFSHRTDSLKIIAGLAAYFRLSWSWRLQYIYDWDQERIRSYIGSNILFPKPDRELLQLTGEWERRFMKQVQGDYRGAGRIIERALARDLSRMFYKNFHSINTVSCYLALLYRQIRNLFSIVDGLRFGLSPDVIMENIICEG